MVNLKSETHGKGATKDVNLFVIAYDGRVARDSDGKETTRYLDARLHPGDRRAKGETSPALVSKRDANSPSGWNNSARYSANQFQSIVAAAGDNVVDLEDKDGQVLGKIYGVKADLLINKGEVIINTKTVKPSELSVEPNAEGKDIRAQSFDSVNEAKAAREAAKSAAAAEKDAGAEVTAPEADREPALVGAGAPVASSDEPGLG